MPEFILFLAFTSIGAGMWLCAAIALGARCDLRRPRFPGARRNRRGGRLGRRLFSSGSLRRIA